MVVSDENDTKLRSANQRLLFSSISKDDFNTINLAKSQIRYTWALSQLVKENVIDPDFKGIQPICNTENRDRLYAIYNGGPIHPEIESSLFDKAWSYRDLMAYYMSHRERFEQFENTYRGVCLLSIEAASNESVVVNTSLPGTGNDLPKTTIINGQIVRTGRSGEIFITNHLNRAISDATVDYEIFIPGRAVAIARGEVHLKFVGGLEPGESEKQLWSLGNNIAAISEAVEDFGSNQLRSRACYRIHPGNCLVTADHLISSLAVLSRTAHELAIILSGQSDSKIIEDTELPTTST